MRLRLWARVFFVLSLAAVLVWAGKLALARLLPARPREDLSCHDLQYPSEIPNIEDTRPPLQSIFFLETSCRSHKVGGISLTPRQACAVESAALRNPGYQVYVLFAAPVSSTSRSDLTDRLLQYKNLHFRRVRVSSYVARSAVHSLPEKLQKKSQYDVHHTSDLLRFLTLWRHPGIYLDLDMISAKGLEHMPSGSWTVAKSKNVINDGAFAFDDSDTGRVLAKEAINELWEMYDGSKWWSDGSGVLQRVIPRLCTLHGPSPTEFPVNCTGFQVLGPERVYPVYDYNWPWYSKLRTGGSGNDASFEKAVFFHFRGWLSDTHPPPPRISAIESLARAHCPTTFNLTRSYF